MGSAAVLSARLESRGAVARLLLSGELDVGTAPSLKQALTSVEGNGFTTIILDLRDLTFIDTSGLLELMQASDRAKSNRHRLWVVGARPRARRVAELVGARLQFHDEEDLSENEQIPGRARLEATESSSDLPVGIADLGRVGPPLLPGTSLDGTDRVLMKAIAGGDTAAFRELFDRYAPTAIALARRILRDPKLAEDAVQEVFLAVWRDAGRYRPTRGTVRGWLMFTTHHRAVDLVRREEAQRRHCVDAAAAGLTDMDSEDLCESVVERIGLAEEGKIVRRALEALPPEQRRIINVMYFRGLSQRQTSEFLQLPLGTVKSRARLGMRRLRDALADEGAGPLSSTTTTRPSA